MRKLRILILTVSAVVMAIFAGMWIREYRTSDSKAPVIHADTDELYLSVNSTQDDLLAGMTASDNLDGDVSNTLVVVSKSKFISKGVQRVNYAAFDNNNNVGIYSRNVTYTDYVSPHFSVSKPLRYLSGSTNYNYLQDITAIDALDGNITHKVKVTYGDVEAISDTVSYRSINLLVTNSAGDSSVLPLNVTFEDSATYTTRAPALKDYVMYVTAGTRPDLRSNLSGIWAGGRVSSFESAGVDPDTSVIINDGGIDYSVPGFYTVTYTLSKQNADGYRTNLGTASLVVVVEEQ